MKIVSKVVVFIIAAAICAQAAQRGGGTGNTQAPTSPVTGSPLNGKALYYSHSCYACHGYNGETGRAFVGNWSSNLASEENFIRFLRGRANVAPVTPMHGIVFMPQYLNARAATIYGGSSEVQRNIMAKLILGF